ncbi:hypothetical protein [Halolamina sp.]
MAGAYSDSELAELDKIGAKRTAVALTDIRQRHLGEFGGGRQ